MTARPVAPDPQPAVAGSPHSLQEEAPMSRSPLVRSVRRGATVVASTAALSLVVAMPSPAMASSMFFSKSSGRTVSVQWLEVDHVEATGRDIYRFGDMTVEAGSGGRARAWGNIFDVDCPDGVVPERPGGGHGDEPPAEGPEEPTEPVCTTGMRFIKGGTLTLSMDRRLTKATLTGTLEVASHEGAPARPRVDATWTGVGSAFSETRSGTYTDEYGTYRYRYSFTGRSAAVTGTMGPMNFTGDPDDQSTGLMGSYRNAERGRSS